MAADHLAWFPASGVGYYPVREPEKPYTQAYFDKYVAYADTDMGRRLNAARMALVARHFTGTLVDVGIGCGSFVEARENTLGYDINPAGIRWLRDRGLWWNPHLRPCVAVSLWDALEHMPDFSDLLAMVSGFVFVSIPVFAGPDEVLASRHFRPDEHCWYFSVGGFVGVMMALGWELLELNAEETALGRDGIASFAFRRGN